MIHDIGIKEYNLDICRETAADRSTYIDGSITDERLIESVFEDYDITFVYHEAAQAGVRASVQNPKKPHSINATGLLNLFEAAVDHEVKRFVNASSSSMYGKPDYLPYDEDHPNYPQSPYAVTKLAAEHYCKVWNNVYDLPTVSLRYFTVYGPRMQPNMAITNFTSRCLHDEPPVIYGDGQ